MNELYRPLNLNNDWVMTESLTCKLFTFGPLQVSFIHPPASDTTRRTAQRFWRLFMRVM